MSNPSTAGRVAPPISLPISMDTWAVLLALAAALLVRLGIVKTVPW